uniref:Uncharacterized protein n=1 Tax=Brassica oleracea TaxID=3712 RepID=A0A3P6FS14_BRAOL|nr:unnamed protein product [Brassica oleracea]
MNLSLGGSGRPVLPVSDPPLSGENDTSDGSAMTKHGAYAALSYMAALVINLIQFLVWSLFTSMIRDQDCEYEVVDDDDEYDDNTPVEKSY